MAYAGKIGQCDGVKIFFTRGEHLEVSSVIRIVYYAWNNKTLSSPGYGTMDLKIKVFISPSIAGKEFDEMDFGIIKNSANGNCNLKEGDQLPCGRVIDKRQYRNGDHQYNTVIVELNDSMRKGLSRTVALMQYSTHVNDDKGYTNIGGMFIEKPSNCKLETPEEV